MEKPPRIKESCFDVYYLVIANACNNLCYDKKVNLSISSLDSNSRSAVQLQNKLCSGGFQLNFFMQCR